MTDTKLTLEERSKFESLLAEYANAEMDCVRASGRRHDALHAVLDYVNKRTSDAVALALIPVPPPVVPVGTFVEHPEVGATTLAVPFTSAELDAGAIHSKRDAPVDCCQCGACCTARALSSIGTPSETQFGPPPGQYSGN